MGSRHRAAKAHIADAPPTVNHGIPGVRRRVGWSVTIGTNDGTSTSNGCESCESLKMYEAHAASRERSSDKKMNQRNDWTEDGNLSSRSEERRVGKEGRS